MNKNFKNVLMMSMLATLIASCGGSNNSQDTAGNNSNNNQTTSGDYSLIKKDTQAEIWVMTWSGDAKEHKDIGHNPLATSEIQALNVGMLQGIAKEFNKVYPNIKVNLYTTSADPSSGGTSWSEKLITFKEAHNGRYPDVWASANVIDDMNKGICADLSVYENDEGYQKINPDLLKLMNYYGFQAGLPQYVIPWGVYVNRELAENNNISEVFPDWTWDEYTDFVSAAKKNAQNSEFAGAYDASMMIPRGAFIERQLQNTEKGSEYKVNFATEEFMNAIAKLPAQSEASMLGCVQANATAGDEKASALFASGGQWGYNYFKDNKLLTYDGDPWMLFESNVEGNTNYVNSKDWDIYPRPSIQDANGETLVDNHIGVCLDPLCVYNYALDDNNPELSADEKKKLDVAYTFSKFWLTDSRAWDAKANSYYTDPTTGKENVAINDTFPAIKQGEDFNKQMNIWFSTANHAPYANKEKFPGFNKIVELWSQGAIYGISDKAFPRYYFLEGDATAHEILEPINKFGSEEFVGVSITDPSWLSTYSVFLKQYNKTINENYNIAFKELKDSMKKYYGWSDTDFTAK